MRLAIVKSVVDLIDGILERGLVDVARSPFDVVSQAD